MAMFGTKGSANHRIRVKCLTTFLLSSLAFGGAISNSWAQDARKTEDGGEKVLSTIDVVADKEPRSDGVIRITPEQLDRSNPSDLQDVFADEPGVSVGGSIPTAQKIYVHGIEDAQLNVRIDGVARTPQTFHHNGTVLIDPSLLKSVDVAPGVAPADAGPYALAGSAAFETKDARDLLDPGESWGGSLMLSYDTNSENFAQALTGFASVAGFEALGHFQRVEGQDYEDGADKTIEGTAAGLDNGLLKFAYQAPNGARVELNGDWTKDEANRQDRVNFGNVTTVNSAISPNIFMRQTFSATYTDEEPEGLLDPMVQVSYNRVELDVKDLFAGGGTVDIFSDVSSVGAKAQNRFALGENALIEGGSITGGADFLGIVSKGGRLAHEGDEESKTLGFFGQARLNVIEEARLSFGMRGDQQWFQGIDGSEFSNFGVSGNVSGEVDVTEWATVRAGYANVFGGIPIGESAIQDFSGTWTYDGLKPSRALSYTGGVSFQTPFGLSADVGFYYTEIDDAHSLFSSTRNTTNDVRTQGMDVGLRYDYQDAFVSLKYSHTNVEIDDEPPGTTSYYLATPIGEVMALHAGYDVTGLGLIVGATSEIAFGETRFTSTDASDREIDGYKVFNMYSEYTPAFLDDVLTLRLEANNILNAEYVARSTAGNGNAVIEPATEPGRSFLMKAKANF